MKILVLTQNYVPDLAASSFRMKALVDEMTDRGHFVTVLSGVPNRYASMTFSKDDLKVDGQERMIWINRPRQKGRFLRRSLGDVWFLLKSMLVALPEAREADVLVATSPHLWVGFLGSLLSWVSGKPLVLDIRDLWPDVIAEMGILPEKSMLFKVLKSIEKFMYLSATRIVVNSPAFSDYIKKYTGQCPVCITNGIDDAFFHQLAALPCNAKGKGLYRITYAGNLGMAQDLGFFLDVAKRFEGKYEFQFIGDGSDKAHFERLLKEKGIANVFLAPPVQRKELLKYYANTDAFFVQLKPIPMFEKTIPSKIFEYVATGKPVVYGLKGIAGEIMQKFQGKRWRFEPGDPESLALVFAQLYDCLESGTDWNGAKGQALLKDDFLRSVLCSHFAEVIERVVLHVAKDSGGQAGRPVLQDNRTLSPDPKRA